MIQLVPIEGLPFIHAGDPLAELLVGAMRRQGIEPIPGDVLVIAQKVVSKAEGRVRRLAEVTPSPAAVELAAETEKDPRLVELILQESNTVLRRRRGLIVVEDARGLVCANAGIDRSNVEQAGGESVLLLPEDPDSSARAVRATIEESTGHAIGIIINDSHGRPFRIGTVGVAIGVAGIPALSDRRGDADLTGFVLQHTVIGLADELAAAASLLMGPAAEAVPAVLIRGLQLTGEGQARDLLRAREYDMFR